MAAKGKFGKDDDFGLRRRGGRKVTVVNETKRFADFFPVFRQIKRRHIQRGGESFDPFLSIPHSFGIFLITVLSRCCPVIVVSLS